MKIYQVTYIDYGDNFVNISFPSIAKAKKWIRENKDNWEQVFEDIITIEIERLTKKSLIEVLNR